MCSSPKLRLAVADESRLPLLLLKSLIWSWFWWARIWWRIDVDSEAVALSSAAPATCESSLDLISHGISTELRFPRLSPRRAAKISLRFLNESECSLVFAIPSFSPGLHYMINDLLGGHWQKSPHTSQAINNNDYWFFYAPRHETKWTKMTCGLSGLTSGAASGLGHQRERHIISVGCKLG